MQNNQAAQTNVSNVKNLAPADGWLRLKITPKKTKENPNPKAMYVTRDVPLSARPLVTRSIINMEIAHQDKNPGATPLEFTFTGTINIPGANDDKEDLVF